MQYSPKLKKAMAEIKDILSKHDIAGMIVIAEPGFSELLNKLDPTFSCIKVNGDSIRFKSKITDYNGDKAAQVKQITESINILQTITEYAGMNILALMDLTEQLEKDFSAGGQGGTYTSHTTQNN
jgi:hypothetical protein